MAYNQIPFKTSRGVAAYIAANAPAGLPVGEIYAHKSSGYREFPNVTCLVTHFYEEMDNPGCYHVNVLVSIRTACTVPVNPSGTAPDPAYVSEAIVGAVADLFETMVGTDRSALAEAITASGRALATNGTDGDMALFKVDSIAPLPNATSAAEGDHKVKNWVDDFPFELVVRAVADVEPV